MRQHEVPTSQASAGLQRYEATQLCGAEAANRGGPVVARDRPQSVTRRVWTTGIDIARRDDRLSVSLGSRVHWDRNPLD